MFVSTRPLRDVYFRSVGVLGACTITPRVQKSRGDVLQQKCETRFNKGLQIEVLFVSCKYKKYHFCAPTNFSVHRRWFIVSVFNFKRKNAYVKIYAITGPNAVKALKLKQLHCYGDFNKSCQAILNTCPSTRQESHKLLQGRSGLLQGCCNHFVTSRYHDVFATVVPDLFRSPKSCHHVGNKLLIVQPWYKVVVTT